MATYAVIENGTVINVIVADSKEIAEQVTEKECIEYTEENTLAIGATWNTEFSKYVNPKPESNPSFVYDGNNWVPPITMPIEEGKYFLWSEDLLSWNAYDIVVPDPEGEIIEE